MREFFGTIDIWQVLSSFIFLFAIIDPLGNIPVTLNMQRKGVKINAFQVCLATIVILLAFLFAGEWVLKLFGVKIEYFAIAGGFVILLMALEMVLDVTIFKNEGLDGSGSIVPLAFPMYAGPGAFTALLSITAEYDIINLVLAVTLNTLMLFAVLKGTNWLNKYLGQTSLYILRKFFGIIVLAPKQVDELYYITKEDDVPVLCYGLRCDFQMKGFPGSTRLLEIADDIKELKTICKCGQKATQNLRTLNGLAIFEGNQILIDGESDIQYEGVCGKCYINIKRGEKMKKRYLVIMQDEWNNLYYMGEYKELKDSIDDINDFLKVYDVSIKSEDLKEYASTFGGAFDLDIGMMYEDRDDLVGIMVRGFILYD